jgi:hypothetical protein
MGKIPEAHNINIFKKIYYVILNEYILLYAWHDFFRRKYSSNWEKIDSNR